MLSPVEPWVPGGVQADRGIWETEGPGEPALTLPHSSPAEASQQMAKLSEVLALRMENYEQVMECNAPDSSFLKGMGKAGKRLIYNRLELANSKGAYAGLKIGEAGNNWNNNAGNWE